MDPPDDYRQGYQRFCLACWLGVGPKDWPDTGNEATEGRVGNASGRSAPDLGKPDVVSLRSILARGFRAENPEMWTDFLGRFGQTEGRICYYPSAGSDFRPVIYQQLAGMMKLGFVDERGDILRPGSEPGESSKYAPPDLWILSDFRGDDLPNWQETNLVHRDERVEIQLHGHTEIYPQRMDLQRTPSRAYTSLSPTEMTGRVFYLRLALMNTTIGTIETDVLYFCVENVNLIRSWLLRKHIPLTHLVWVRDGSGFGGGRWRHDFLIPLLALFKTRWLFISEHYHQSLGKVKWPRELRLHEQLLAGESPDLHAIGSLQSGDDRVVFCEVDSARADVAMRMQRMRLAERMNPQEESPSLYLWLCCEGWMRFGPFKWLRFDDERQAILGPDRDEVAKKMDGFWRVSGEKWQGWGFSDPTITTTPQHPHKDSSSPPVLKR